MEKGDLYIVAITLIIFGMIFIFYKISIHPDEEKYIEIRIKNELITTVELTQETNMKILLLTYNDQFLEYKILNPNETLPETMKGFDLIYIHDNGVQVLNADCPRRIIVKQGFMKYENIPLICLPRKLSITIKSQQENTILDGIAS